MTNGVDLAAAAVDAVARAGAAALTAVGTGAGNTAVEIVRGRLSGVQQGPEAVSAVERAPEDADARARLREKLAAVLAEDPAFASYLASVLAPPRPAEPPSHTTGSIHIDRGARAKGTFVLGDQAITKIRKGDPVALLGLGAVIVVLALVVYGLAGLIGGDDDASAGGGSGHKVTALKDLETVKSVAPDLHAMPAGWASTSEPSVSKRGSNACKPSEPGCEGVLSIARSQFDSQSRQSVAFVVAACASAEAAKTTYRDALKEARRGKPLSVSAAGQESMAYEVSTGEARAVARIGTVVVSVTEESEGGTYEVATLDSLLRMVAARAQQAQDGETPSARAQ
ncbi:hypothetical protein [Streptomyces sp. NPDC089919]|uniref:hypothetical protein n=1 Tax=Streptomyces sp. NPDC089919 TaxID=3155188 RepID=UPI0034288A21